MALFAAYADSNEPIPETSNVNNEWLTLSSFKIDVTPEESSNAEKTNKEVKKTHKSNSLESSREYPRHKKTKRRKKKHEKTKAEDTQTFDPFDNVYIIDKKAIPEYKTVNTISRPCAPKYHIKAYLCNRIHKYKKKKFKRYYQVILDKHINVSDTEQETLTKTNLNDVIPKDTDTYFTGFKQEEDMTKQTAYYNKALAEDPYNIEMWLKYANFQDSVFQFEKTYRKGSIAKGLRVTAERKLAILDKALIHNPNCEELHRTQLNIAVCVYPADELKVHLEKLVEKDKGNIILWQGYIEASQCSMSHCNTPTVIMLYIKCLHTLHTLRRTAKLDKAQLEENILRMLYQCGLFLKQAGLFEQLWTLLRLYLELNLSIDGNNFNANLLSNDKQLVELEEVVLNSQLPIHELWLRIEKLREACHWLPYNGSNCEDPQRVVFSDDVAELIHPITMPGNTFKLTVTVLTLLKIPLLPCRHTTMQEFGIDYVPWALDSIETVLPIFFPLYPIDLSNKHLLKHTQKLAVGPQYLKTLPGQEEYLQFILTIMKSCIDCLNGIEKTAITVWWFRFQRLLIILENEELFKITKVFKKKLKVELKHKLKSDPNNIILYREFALIEYESGNHENAINVLKTALIMKCQSISVHDLRNEEEQSAVCSTFRTLIELFLRDNEEINKDICLKYIIQFVLGRNLQVLPEIVDETDLNAAKSKFSEITSNILNCDLSKLQLVQHFLPDFTTDWIICNAWFLYLNNDINACRILIENVLNQTNDQFLWQKELLHEFIVAILFKSCIEKPGSGLFPLLDTSLQKAVEMFPNNIFLLAVIAKVQSKYFCLGQPWWKIKSLLLKTGHALPSLFMILIANQRNSNVEDNWTDTITGELVVRDPNFKNRMLSLFRNLTSNGMCTRRCGLVWRLYLQFLNEYFDPKMCRNAYYGAVEECPWLKALYIDAAIYIPEELPQIQDLIIEKQLRIHVTPEELDVLRN